MGVTFFLSGEGAQGVGLRSHMKVMGLDPATLSTASPFTTTVHWSTVTDAQVPVLSEIVKISGGKALNQPMAQVGLL